MCDGNEIKIKCYDAEFGEVDAKIEEVIRHESDLQLISVYLGIFVGDSTFLRDTLDIIKSSIAFILYVKVSHMSNP